MSEAFLTSVGESAQPHPAVLPDSPDSAHTADSADGLFPAPPPAPPHTGDQVVDRVLADLHVALAGDLDQQIETADAVGEALHRRLQDLDSE